MSLIQGADWTGKTIYATKKQLISSITGLYADLQDIELSTITVANLNVSTLTSAQYISTPELYVSSIIGGGLQVNDGFLQISTGNISLVSLSTLSFKGIDLGGIDFNFDLGLGNAIGGFLGGLGALVGGVFIGLGTGTGLAIQGITNGLFSLANTRGDSVTNINSNVFETINGTTQIQISTLGNAYPNYSSIFRTISSESVNSIPGQEIFISTIFPAGTTCVRSVSDPLPLITNNSTINTSSIQSLGEWVPFLDPTVTSEDIYARNAYFSSIILDVVQGGIGIQTFQNTSQNDVTYWGEATHIPQSFNYPVTSNNTDIAQTPVQHIPLYQQFFTNATIGFISTPYNQYTSTIGNSPPGGIFFINSSITDTLSTIPKFTYVGNALGGGNFAIAEDDESNFLSTATMDFIAQSSNILIQWGLAVDNRNSTIGVGTGKRVTWDNTAATSNFIDIPVPQSTIVTNPTTVFQIKQQPLEVELNVIASPDTGFGGQGAMSFNVSRAVFGINDTSFDNQPGYPYQFNGNLFINGNLEADTLIALSSIVNVSTNIQTFFSTQTFDADEATISSLTVTSFLTSPQASISSLVTSSFEAKDAFFSTLRSSDLIEANGISTFGIENYAHLSQFSYISTLVVDFQILEGFQAPVTTRLNNILGDPGSRILMTTGGFQDLSTLTFSTNSAVASNAFIPNIQNSNLLTSSIYANTISSATINTNTISSISQVLQNLNFSTITVPNLSYDSYNFNSTTNVYVNENPTFYVFPTDGFGREVVIPLDPMPGPPTSTFVTITEPIVPPFFNMMFRLEIACSYANCNRAITAGLAVFVNGIQGPSRNLYANQNPTDFLYNQQVSFVIDPRFWGIISSLDVRFYLEGAPQGQEFIFFESGYYSLV